VSLWLIWENVIISENKGGKRREEIDERKRKGNGKETVMKMKLE